MSFRLRIVFMTTILMTVLFCIGGVVVVHTTFQASLQKEEQAAVDSNELILKLVQLIGDDREWFSETELISIMNNLCRQDAIDSLQLTCEKENIYQYEKKESILEYANQEVEAPENQVLVTYFLAHNEAIYLQTTTQFRLHGRIYFFNMTRNLTNIYQVREEQIEAFQKTFLFLLLIGIFCSWILATFLTRSLRKLTKATKEIGVGNFSYRSKIKSDDEIGALSKEFDKMAEALESNITLLKESAEQKELFMGAFTHELKTPMTSIIGYADLLRTQKLSCKDEADALDYIFSEAKRLENLSLKMLDLFVVDKKEIILKECSPAMFTRYVTKHLKKTYEKNNIKIEVKAESGICYLEPDLFQTLLINLLDNAKKSMEQGGIIDVTVCMTEKGCMVKVKDQGKGIPKDALKHLTEAFFRVDKARARNHGNAGLGLALCQKIVELHNGDMQFESQEGIGTLVTVHLKGGWNEE